MDSTADGITLALRRKGKLSHIVWSDCFSFQAKLLYHAVSVDFSFQFRQPKLPRRHGGRLRRVRNTDGTEKSREKKTRDEESKIKQQKVRYHRKRRIKPI